MISPPRQRRRPAPLQIPRLEIRREDEEGAGSTPKKASSPTKSDAVRPSSSQVRSTGAAATASISSTRRTITLPSSSTSTLRLSTTTLQLPTIITSSTAGSPTKTSFVTVTQSIKSPKEKEKQPETPEPTQTVFLSATPQIVTVTAAPGVSAAETLAPKPTSQQGNQQTGVLSGGAKVPIIVMGVIAAFAMVFTIGVVLWWRRKRKTDSKVASENGPMTEIDDGGFRAISDKRPILS